MRNRDGIRSLAKRGWFSLTAEERWFTAAVLALLLLGMGARYWHATTRAPAPLDSSIATEAEKGNDGP